MLFRISAGIRSGLLPPVSAGVGRVQRRAGHTVTASHRMRLMRPVGNRGTATACSRGPRRGGPPRPACTPAGSTVTHRCAAGCLGGRGWAGHLQGSKLCGRGAGQEGALGADVHRTWRGPAMRAVMFEYPGVTHVWPKELPAAVATLWHCDLRRAGAHQCRVSGMGAGCNAERSSAGGNAGSGAGKQDAAPGMQPRQDAARLSRT